MYTRPVNVEIVKDFHAKKNLEKDKCYKGFLGRPLKEAIEGTARNVAAVAVSPKWIAEDGQSFWLVWTISSLNVKKIILCL